MWRDLKISLYDLFGYFFPGAILLIAITMTIPWSAKADTWAVLILAAYLAGHVVQAVANIIFPSRRRIATDMKSVPKVIMDAVDDELEALLFKDSLPAKKPELNDILKPFDKFLLCDTVLTQKGNIENRDIFVYREGFYKGLTVSFFIFFLGLAYWLPAQELLIKMGQKPVSLPFQVLLILQICALGVTVLFYKRYVRFSQYKTNEAFYGFLAHMRTLDKEGKKAG